jgi:hypothetical protein
LHLFSFGLVDGEFLHEFFCFDGGLLEFWLHDDEFFLHVFHCLVGLKQLVESVLKTRNGQSRLFLLVPENALVGRQQFQVDGRRHMVDPAQFTLEPHRLLLDALVDRLEYVHEGIQFSLEAQFQLDFLELPLSNSDEGLFGPLAEPVDGGAVDEGGEHAESRGDGVADGAHADDDVDVAFDPGEIH